MSTPAATALPFGMRVTADGLTIGAGAGAPEQRRKHTPEELRPLYLAVLLLSVLATPVAPVAVPTVVAFVGPFIVFLLAAFTPYGWRARQGLGIRRACRARRHTLRVLDSTNGPELDRRLERVARDGTRVLRIAARFIDHARTTPLSAVDEHHHERVAIARELLRLVDRTRLSTVEPAADTAWDTSHRLSDELAWLDNTLGCAAATLEHVAADGPDAAGKFTRYAEFWFDDETFAELARLETIASGADVSASELAFVRELLRLRARVVTHGRRIVKRGQPRPLRRRSATPRPRRVLVAPIGAHAPPVIA